MSAISAVRAADDTDDLREPSSLLESIRILRSHDPHYMAILSPSEEQIEDIDAIIKGLRLEIDDGVDETTGDETAYELAVALLWHTTPDLVKEGIDLMEYLLKERWSQRWSTVTHGRDTTAGALVESVAEEPNEGGLDGGVEEGDEEWVDLDVSHHTGRAGTLAQSSAGRAANASADSRSGAVRVGTAVSYATAPPPPEEEGGSVPPSLVRGREGGAASSVLTRQCTSSSAAAPGEATTSTRAQDSARGGGAVSTPSTTSATGTSTSSYTSPGTDSSVCTAAAGASAVASSSAAREALAHDERLAKCYYHLAVGCTKLRRNDQGLFYVNNVLQLCPNDRDALRLKRLLCARVYLRGMVARSVPFLAIGLLFL